LQIGVLAAGQGNKQIAGPKLPTPSLNPPQAPTAAADIPSADVLTVNLCSKQPAAAECRICLSAGNAEQELIQPCSCAGTMGYTHAACLEAWVQEKGSLTCELCKQQYKEQFVETHGLAAAADNAKGKEGAEPPAAVDANSLRSWQRMRFTLL
jgi:hypothetical protein